jgi:hypothetical protein
LRIEISGPRIYESHSSHYFEFNLAEYELRSLSYHASEKTVEVRVPSREYMAAVKLGLPVDYKK